VLVGVPDPDAVAVGLDVLVGLGDVVGFAVLVALGATVGLGVVDGCTTVLLGDRADVARCPRWCEGAEADEFRCCTVLFPTSPLVWPAMWPLTYRPAAAARAQSTPVVPATTRARRRR